MATSDTLCGKTTAWQAVQIVIEQPAKPWLTGLPMSAFLRAKCNCISAKDKIVIDYLERRFGRFAIPNVTVILIIGQVMMYFLIQSNQELWIKSALLPREVLNGDLLRLITFLFLPPGDGLLFAFFFWYLFYLMGTALEFHWGTFRFNMFLLIGYFATVASSFITPDGVFTNHYVEGTIFLAFAFLNPTFELRLAFIFPIQIRWLALFAWITYSINFIWGPWPVKLQVAASVFNFFIFFGRDIIGRVRSGQRTMASKAKRLAVREPDYFHKCTICGVTDKTDPTMDFRYCSKCSGDHAYCSDHLKTHDHLVDSETNVP